MSENDTRLKYLEDVVNDLLKQRKVSDAKNTNGKAGEKSPVLPSVLEEGPVQLVLPAYRVPYNGNTVRVDAMILQQDPALLEYMRVNHPTCFQKL